MAIVLGILVLHAASMGCLWALARFSVTLVDEEGRLIGAVTVDDLLDHLLPANWRDRQNRKAVTRG